METQDLVFALADELRYHPRGRALARRPDQRPRHFAFNSDDTYGGLPAGHQGRGTLYDELRFGPLRAQAASFPDFRSYVRAAVGTSRSSTS